jgi:hypothetical protein
MGYEDCYERSEEYEGYMYREVVEVEPVEWQARATSLVTTNLLPLDHSTWKGGSAVYSLCG